MNTRMNKYRELHDRLNSTPIKNKDKVDLRNLTMLELGDVSDVEGYVFYDRRNGALKPCLVVLTSDFSLAFEQLLEWLERNKY